MASFRWATANVGVAGPSLDRVCVEERDGALLVVLADGAGGVANGAAAADAVIAARASWAVDDALASDGREAVAWIGTGDRAVAAAGHGGECTAVVAVVRDARVVGASVGDSVAWVCTAGGVVALTASQRRRPFVGSAAAVAVPFAGDVRSGRLLVASDGLWKYAAVDRLRAAATHGDVERAAEQLVELVRLPSGWLQDDVSLALVEREARPLELDPRQNPGGIPRAEG
jgi:serine/threonine protein phosphatase PrpC